MKLLNKLIFAGALALASLSGQAQDGYELIEAPQATDADGKVEVIEFFWYGCPHCFEFEPHIGEWEKNIPENASFVRMAPPLNPAWKLHSQAYYAAEVMGVLDKFHEPMFNAIHKDRKRMRKEKEILKFVESLGLDAEKFGQTMKSFSVDAKIRQSMQKAKDVGISAVPSVIVAGKYRASGSTAGSYPNLINVINELVKKESGG